MSRQTATRPRVIRRGQRAVELARRQLGQTLKALDHQAPTTVRRAARDVARSVAGDRVGQALVTIVLTASDDDLEYLDEALRSAVDQSHRSLEILVVPYGTADRLPIAVKGWLGADHRIRLIRAVPPSLSAARDHGARLAKGRYLCFLRGHDTLPVDAVAGAFSALRRSGSDFAIGRLSAPASLLPSVLPRRDPVHEEERLHTTLSEFPAVITDMSLGNRMFSTGFWRSQPLSFRAVEGETQLVLQCFETGRAFDVIGDATYTERTRGDASPVEQMYDSTGDLPGWLRDAKAVGDRLRGLGDRLYEHWLVGVCDNQLQTFLGDTERMSEQLWGDLRDAVAHLREGVDERAWTGLRAESRVKLALLLQDRRTALEEFIAARWFERDNVPTMIESGRLFARLPSFDDPTVGVDRSAFELHEDETPARMHLRSLRSGQADQLELDLLVRVELLDLAGEQPVITARLVPGDGGQTADGQLISNGSKINNGPPNGRRQGSGDGPTEQSAPEAAPESIELVVRPRFDELANLTINHRYQDYRPGGCTVEIDRNALPAGVWRLETTISVAGVQRSTDLITVDRRGPAGLMGTRYLPVHNTASDTAVSIGQRQRRLVLEVKDAEPVVMASVSVSDRTVRLSLDSQAGSLSSVTAQAAGVRAEAPVVDGIAELRVPNLPGGASPTWQLRAIADDGNAYPLRWPSTEPWLAVGEGALVAVRTEWGNAMLAEASAVAVLDQTQLRSGAVRVSGHWLGADPPRDLEMVVTGPRYETRHPLRSDRPDRFEFDIPVRWDPWGLGEVGIPRGEYVFSIAERTDGKADDQNASPERRIWVGADFVASLEQFQLGDGVRVRPLCRRNRAIGFTLTLPLPIEESGAYPQQRLQQACLDGMGPIDPSLVYFSSYDGAQPTDSGLAIHHELRRRYPQLRSVWGVSDPRTPVPEGASAVLINSPEWYQVLSTAGYLVQNVDFPRWWRKRPGQRFLQSFHGYPAKSMGLRMWRAKEFTPRRLQAELDRTMAGWDLILTPVPEMDQYYRREYAYRGPIHNQGYPRDDALVLPSAAERRELVRSLLGIRSDQKAILYAPTWRDHLASSYQSAAVVDNLDVASASAELGDDYVLLLRGHRFTSRNRSAGPRMTRIIDVTEYPEINDLILAADAAVLDYSSLRFDFALTGRPMIFLVPDLDDYTGGVRGFLFDYRDTAPGPLTETADQVITALRDLDGLAATYRERIAEFNAKYQYLQDGHAADRVVQRFFGDDQSG